MEAAVGIAAGRRRDKSPTHLWALWRLPTRCPPHRRPWQRAGHRRRHAQAEIPLPGVQTVLVNLEQDGAISLVVGRAERLDTPPNPAAFLRDLHGGHPGGRLVS